MPPATPASEPRAADRHPPTRCILWRPASTATPAELLASLHKRGISITDCTDPYAALAHICRLEHAPPDRVILLLVSPTQLDGAPEALDTAGRYAPHAASWWYDARTSEKLQRITPEDIAGWAARDRAARTADGHAGEPFPAAEPAPSPRPTGGPPRRAPALRLISDDTDAALYHTAPLDAEVGHDGEPDPDSPTPTTLLTNEELAMLLADPPTTAPTTASAADGTGAPTGSQPAPAARTPWWRRPDSGADR